jgi:hypothetical protein
VFSLGGVGQMLDGRITNEMYDVIVAEQTSRQQELDEELMTLTHSNKGFLVTMSYLVDLSQRSSVLFNKARPQHQQKLLKIVLSNMVLNDKRLSYIVNDLYKTFIEANKKSPSQRKSDLWCSLYKKVYTLSGKKSVVGVIYLRYSIRCTKVVVQVLK